MTPNPEIKALERIRDLSAVWPSSLVSQIHEIACAGLGGVCGACGGNGRYNDNYSDCQPCLRCQGTGLQPEQEWPDCLDSNASHNRRAFRKAAQGHGRAGTADWPGGPYMAMDDAADVYATMVATQPATSQEGEAVTVPREPTQEQLAAGNAMFHSGEVPLNIYRAMVKAAPMIDASLRNALESIARPFPDGCNWEDQANACQVVAQVALAATPTPSTLSEDLREALKPFAAIPLDGHNTPDGYPDPRLWREHLVAARAALAQVKAS